MQRWQNKENVVIASFCPKKNEARRRIKTSITGGAFLVRTRSARILQQFCFFAVTSVTLKDEKQRKMKLKRKRNQQSRGTKK